MQIANKKANLVRNGQRRRLMIAVHSDRDRHFLLDRNLFTNFRTRSTFEVKLENTIMPRTFDEYP